jgi:glycosyltransferase involved in cell wall biosynthesis
MKVGFVAPLGIAAVNGGVRTQVQQTAAHLHELGVQVEFISPWTTTLDIDLAHIFVSGPGTLAITNRFKELDIPVVVSPVFYSNRSAGTISKSLKLEKTLGLFGSGIRSDFGIKAEVCALADLLLPNTSEEADLITKGFGVDPEKINIVPNGVEDRFQNGEPQLFTEQYDLKDFVLFVGQAGAPRKNVKALLEVAGDIDSHIVIIGSLFDDEYGDQCRSLAKRAGNVTFIKTIDHDSELLASAYAACHTFVLPSYYETPGIAAMEAALTGARIVITEKGGTKDYFQDFALYINPESTSSIKTGVNSSLNKEKDEVLRTHILDHYTWDKVADQTLKAYKKLIN